MKSHIQLLGNRVQMLTRLNPNSRPRVLIQCRGLATATPAREVLPLKGIKVLDMTRVLAGVSFSLFILVALFPTPLSAFVYCVVKRWHSRVRLVRRRRQDELGMIR